VLFISGVAVMVAACWPLVIDSRIEAATYDLPLLPRFRAIPSTWTPPYTRRDVRKQPKRGASRSC
jgi:hypothetical protein